MTTNYSYTAHEYAAIKANPSRKIKKGLKRIIVIAGIIFAAELIWLFGIRAFVPFSSIEVHAIEGFSRMEILRLAGITENSSYMSTNAVDIQERLLTNILVESARVIKRYPDKLSVFLVPRQAAAAALGFSGSRQRLVYVDRNGVFFKTGEAGENTGGLPILSGFENAQVYMRLPAALIPLVEDLSDIAASSPELLAVISEIRIEAKAWEGYDLVLYPVHSSIRVRVENNLSEEILRYMLLMLNVLESGSVVPQEVDFRSGMGSYKVKEPAVW